MVSTPGKLTQAANSLAVGVVTVLAITFLTLGAHKVLFRAEFTNVIESHRIFTGPLASATGAFIGPLEIAVACATLGILVVRNRIGPAMLPMILLTAAITVYAAALWRHPPPSPTACGCGFSRTPVESWAPITLRAAALCVTCGFISAFAWNGRAMAPRPRTASRTISQTNSPTPSER